MLVFKNGNETVDVKVLNDLNNGMYEITYDEAVRILKQNKFNDDKFGQICASYDGPDDEDPYWIYVDDISNDEEYEMFDDYSYYYLVPSTERGTELVTNWMTELDTDSENDLHLEKKKHLLSFKKFNENFGSKVDMEWLAFELKKLKKENPGKRVSYTFSDQGSGGVVFSIDGKSILKKK